MLEQIKEIWSGDEVGPFSAFEEAGCGELIIFPCSSDPEQVDLLADAVGR